ncbi:MAG TPA: hypothetical protein VFQ30_08995, partial [Ktedonobacteraceae bacterium]|nr:hypothetical protein [Ktedonobacteraceae bacterium]
MVRLVHKLTVQASRLPVSPVSSHAQWKTSAEVADFDGLGQALCLFPTLDSAASICLIPHQCTSQTQRDETVVLSLSISQTFALEPGQQIGIVPVDRYTAKVFISRNKDKVSTNIPSVTISSTLADAKGLAVGDQIRLCPQHYLSGLYDQDAVIASIDSVTDSDSISISLPVQLAK